jgi:hypothetical protein
MFKKRPNKAPCFRNFPAGQVYLQTTAGGYKTLFLKFLGALFSIFGLKFLCLFWVVGLKFAIPPHSIPNPGKFGAVGEGVRASVSPLGGSFCTRV